MKRSTRRTKRNRKRERRAESADRIPDAPAALDDEEPSQDDAFRRFIALSSLDEESSRLPPAERFSRARRLLEAAPATREKREYFKRRYAFRYVNGIRTATDAKSERASISTAKRGRPLGDVVRDGSAAISEYHVWWLLAAVLHIALIVAFALGSPIDAACAAVFSLLVAVLVRDNELIYALHRATRALVWCSTSQSGAARLLRRVRPVALRLLHHIGGLHVACSFWCAVWFTIYAASPPQYPIAFKIVADAAFGTAIAAAILIWLLMLFAATPARRRAHNLFEYSHRFGGWALLFVVIAHVVLVHCGTLATDASTASRPAYSNPVIYALAVITILIFYPWLLVRRVQIVSVSATKNHAAITLEAATSAPLHGFYRVSRNLLEWHSFALAHVELDRSKFDLLITRAGDWTSLLIDDFFDRPMHAPRTLYLRRPGQGFANTLHAYRRVLVVCTGGGIAPASMYWLAEDQRQHVHLLWVTKQPADVYPEKYLILTRLFRTARIHDTALDGRPDGGMCVQHALTLDIEAVFIVSNEPYTFEQVQRFRTDAPHLDVFGATFDS
jgi:hypothetical protein